jgi:predicted TIM-barrel fold metal-dependent hydrolase
VIDPRSARGLSFGAIKRTETPAGQRRPEEIEMDAELLTTANPLMREIGPATYRAIDALKPLDLPAGTVIASADGHWEISDDIFYEGFPADLRDQAPRVWYDQFIRVGFRGETEAYPITPQVAKAVDANVGPGSRDMDIRLEHMAAEGIEKEILFPQSIPSYFGYPKLDVREAIYSVYNDYIAEVSNRRPGVFCGVGVFANWWDPAKAESCMQQIVDLGLKTFLIPITPGQNPADGKVIGYGDPIMDRFWDVVEEAGLPVNFHVGEGVGVGHRGGIATRVMTSLAPFRKPLAELIFSGTFDRHPSLRIVFSEGGISWVPPALQDAEMIFDSYGNGNLLEPIKLRPSDYWHQNCYASFQNDLLGLRQLDIIGADRVMWASDYPHSEGSFGFSRQSIQSVIDAAGSEAAGRIVGGTAIELYKL